MRKQYLFALAAMMAQLVPAVSYADDAWLGWAWDMENVPYARTTADDGMIVYIACHNIAVTNDCIRSDSQVTLSDGSSKLASKIAVGDHLRGPEGDVQVLSVSHIDGDALFYRINDFKFTITGDHPIQTTKGWKSVDMTMKYKDVVTGRLEVGDKLVTRDGEQEVKSITVEKPKKGTQSIDIRTAGDRSFFVDGVSIKPFKDIAIKY